MMQNILKNKIADSKSICLSLGMKRLYVFGSVVFGNFKKESNIDLITERTLPILISSKAFMKQNNWFMKREIKKIFPLNKLTNHLLNNLISI